MASTTSQDFQVCEACNIVVRPANALAAHTASSLHIERTQGNLVRCTVCDICFHRGNWPSHINGQGHRQRANMQGLRPNLPPQIPVSAPNYRKCHLCRIFVPDIEWVRHPSTPGHLGQMRARQEVQELKETLRRAKADKDGVTVSHAEGMDMGMVDTSEVHSGVRGHLIVKTTGETTIKFLRARILTTRTADSTLFTTQQQANSPLIVPGKEFHLIVTFRSSQSRLGRSSANIELSFENSSTQRRFIIIRFITVVVGDKSDFEATAPTKEYEPRQRRGYRYIPHGSIEPGERPKAFAHNPYPFPLGMYPVPKELRDALENGSQEVGEAIKRLPAAFRLPPLSKQTYSKSLGVQLWIEEHRAILDMQVYDMFDQRLQKEGYNYYLPIPGLSENRPSVVLGDGVLLQRTGAPMDKWYEGVVHLVRRDNVGLRFAPSFPFSPTTTYSVRFTFNRYPLRRQHQAIHRPFMEDRVFFPVETHIKLANSAHTLRLHNAHIASNPEQLLAVKTIVNLPPGAHPFIVYGPPGTGKTVTIVEAILRLLRRTPGAKVLACAPSNSASDLLAERLLEHIDKSQVRRFYAPSRSTGLTSTRVLECTYRENGVFAIPTKEDTMTFRVVVATCVGAAFALNTGVPPGHFDWIFVDEAGQGTEPEAMVSIKGMSGPRTNIVLSGDPKQLRPIIRSGVAAELGLGKSYLERLMERTIYDEVQGRGRTLVKLLKNFRSHEKILEFPNRTFYGNELQVHADRRVVNIFEQWPNHPRPRRSFPVIFHAISGNNEREASSPSYFNRLEASQVKSYVRQVLSGGIVGAKDIGVITPYHAQVMKIRQLLKPIAPDTQVASVELFQGQERKVIIMSTVRSTQDLVAYDLRHTLGFVGNPRRFNVAMTRGRALLIVVGDPAVLGLDPLWRSWLNFVYLGGGWTGSSGPAWNPAAEVREAGGYDREIQELGLEEMRALTARMEALSMGRNIVGEDDTIGAYETDARDAE